MKKKCIGVVKSVSELAMDVFEMWIETEIAKDAKPGQFIGVFPAKDSTLLPRPISICEIDKGIVKSPRQFYAVSVICTRWGYYPFA